MSQRERAETREDAAVLDRDRNGVSQRSPLPRGGIVHCEDLTALEVRLIRDCLRVRLFQATLPGDQQAMCLDLLERLPRTKL